MTTTTAQSAHGRFHGDHEGYAQIYSGIATVSTLALLCVPWLDILVISRAHSHVQTGHRVVIAVSANVICVTMIAIYINLYRRLSSRIALGGADMDYLDRVRRDFASFASGVSVLALLLWLSAVLSFS